jgi:hypothetical protein
VQWLTEDGTFEGPPGALRIDGTRMRNGDATHLKEILARYRGRDEVRVMVPSEGGRSKMLRLPEFSVDRSDVRLHAELKELLGQGTVIEE